MAGAVDLEEIAPNRFLIHTPRIGGLIKSEGIINGRMFQLTSWRREGLIARLRQRLVTVSTLPDQITSLPVVNAAAAPGPLLPRTLPANERLSLFDGATFGWQPAHPSGAPDVLLPAGAAVRRRRGRGPASFAEVAAEGQSAILRPLSEEQALNRAYAHLAGATLPIRPTPDGPALAEIELPPRYRPVFKRITADGREPLNQAALPLLRLLFERLGVQVPEPIATE